MGERKRSGMRDERSRRRRVKRREEKRRGVT